MRNPLPKYSLGEYLEEITPLKEGFDLVADHVVITDIDANILYANKAVEKNTGFSIEDVLGRNPADLWGGKMPEKFYKDMWRKIKLEKQPFVGEVHNVRKDGTEYWQELHIAPVLDKEGEVKFFIGIEPNITDRKVKERFRDEFILMTGHQLKNPLTTILWTLDWLFFKNGFTDDQEEILKNIYATNKGLINLIEDLLTITKMVDVETTGSKINLAVEIASIINLVQERFTSVVFSFQKPDKDFYILSNKTLTLQALTNIIFNAAEYSDKNAGKVKIALTQKNEHYVFSCEDNGVGIPEEEQSKIFSKFFRASNAKQAKEGGTGLGLYIVKMISDNLDWKVSFQSEVGKGTIFFVEMPAAQLDK